MHDLKQIAGPSCICLAILMGRLFFSHGRYIQQHVTEFESEFQPGNGLLGVKYIYDVRSIVKIIDWLHWDSKNQTNLHCMIPCACRHSHKSGGWSYSED
jgi:hypothetical protein